MNPETRASSENPRKRVKLEEPDRDEKPFQNHPTLYIADGSVILRTGGTLFCVHKSLLSKHSPVFKELFQQEDERFRGLPHYTMEETREDLEALLNVIYDGLYVDVQDLTVETFPTLATILRMASKYKIERPCHEIVARIRKQWPANLADHDSQVALVRVPAQPQLAANDKGKAREGAPPNANGNANFGGHSAYLQQRAHYMNQLRGGQMLPPTNAHAGPAMQNTFARMVPAGGPQLCPTHSIGFATSGVVNVALPPQRGLNQLNVEQDLDAWLDELAQNAGPAQGPAAPVAAAAPAEQENLIIHPASVIAVLRECGYSDAELLFPLFYALSRTTSQFGGGGLGYHLAPLSAADMERFVVGIERLRARHTSLVVSTPAFDAVRDPAGFMHFCREGARDLWTRVVHTLLVTNEQHPHEPIEEWQDIVASVTNQHGQYQVCVDCSKAIVEKIRAYRAALWDSLPRFFELA